MTPFAPFRLTANDAGWFTFNPDSFIDNTHLRNSILVANTVSSQRHPTEQLNQLILVTSVTINHALRQLTWGSLTRLKRRAVQEKGGKTTVGLKAKQEVKKGKSPVGQTASTLPTTVNLLV